MSSGPTILMSSSGLQLQGLKVTGDRNVPAGQLTFVFDLGEVVPFRNEEWIVMDTDTEGMAFFNLSDRGPFVATVLSGQVQINRDPLIWSPEWRSSLLILYHSPYGVVAFPRVLDDIYCQDFCPSPLSGATQKVAGLGSITFPRLL